MTGRRPGTEERLAFIAGIIATFTHDARNHLAIIKETGGLIDDILTMKKSPGSDDIRRVLELVGTITAQVDRTTALHSVLSRFAHRMDTQVSAVRLGEVVEELTILIGRLASQHRITFRREPNPSLKPVETNPSILQFALFTILEDVMSELPAGGRLILATDEKSGRQTITISHEKGIMLPLGEKAGDKARELLASIGAELCISGDRISAAL
jgi:C4-dicarboxylate-specific signal transduction histidine kinase